jgi:hypothetical protein
VLQSTYSTLEGTHLLPIRLDAVRQRPALLQLNLHTHTHARTRTLLPARTIRRGYVNPTLSLAREYPEYRAYPEH